MASAIRRCDGCYIPDFQSAGECSGDAQRVSSEGGTVVKGSRGEYCGKGSEPEKDNIGECCGEEDTAVQLSNLHWPSL